MSWWKLDGLWYVCGKTLAGLPNCYSGFFPNWPPSKLVQLWTHFFLSKHTAKSKLINSRLPMTLRNLWKTHIRRKSKKSFSLKSSEGRVEVEKEKESKQRQIRLKSLVIKSKLTFRTKLCYPPNLHFSLTNTKKTRDKCARGLGCPPSAHKRCGWLRHNR